MTIQTELANILTLINTYIIPLIVAIAILSFFWGIVKFIQASGAEGKGDAVKAMTNGIIGLVVMLSVWGIVNLVGNSFGINGQQTVSLPRIGQ